MYTHTAVGFEDGIPCSAHVVTLDRTNTYVIRSSSLKTYDGSEGSSLYHSRWVSAVPTFISTVTFFEGTDLFKKLLGSPDWKNVLDREAPGFVLREDGTVARWKRG